MAFTPWLSELRPCWHCVNFVSMIYSGTAAVCSLPGGARVRTMPANGFGARSREAGSDDEHGPPTTAV